MRHYDGRINKNAKFNIFIDDSNPNHHLWDNNGKWWFHCSVHFDDGTSKRIRKNLDTSDIELARQRRDDLINGK